MSKPTVFPEKINRREERHVSDDLIAAAVFFYPHDSIKALAERVGLHPRTLSERLTSPSLKVLLANHRAEAFTAALARIQASAAENINAVQQIIRNPEGNARDKIAAVRLMFDVGLKLDEHVNQAPQLRALEAAIESIRESRGASATVETAPTEVAEPAPPTPPLPAESPPSDQIAPEVVKRLAGILEKHKVGG